jgi:thiamine pyrophosphokinase
LVHQVTEQTEQAGHAVIVGNGPAPSAQLLAALLADKPLLLCADGGANTLHGLGHCPAAVVGDLDSADDSLRQIWPTTQWVRVDADDTGTDLQKVLRHAQTIGIKRAALVGVTGGRTDHTLWNLTLLRAFADELDLCIVDDDCLIRRIPESISFAAPVGLTLSLCPLSGDATGITTEGLRWPLTDEALTPGERDGISNEVVASPVKIQVRSGELLLVIQREGAGSDLSLIGATGKSGQG